MNKRFLTVLMAGMAALSIGGAAFAADQSQGAQSDAAQQNPAAKPADGSKEKDAYFAALTKCDALQGVAEKQQCVDAVRKQYGQM